MQANMNQGEKLSTAATALGSALKVETIGEAEKPTTTFADMAMVQAILNEWAAMPKKAAEQTIEKYGPPNEAIPSRLFWYNNGPWKRTIVYRDEIPHNFPQPHTDVIENFINYRVPIEKYSEIARFDGSFIMERTAGEVSARCDMEAANFIAINLVHDIVTGKINAEQAREQQAEITAAFMMNRPAPYAEALQFKVPTESTKNTDDSKIGGALLHQAGEKIKDAFREDDKS